MAESDDKNFWNKLPDEKVPAAPDGPDGETWQLTEHRRDLLMRLRHGEWVDGDNDMAAPWTFVCCHRAGWLERQRLQSRTQYRISDEGLAILDNWHSH